MAQQKVESSSGGGDVVPSRSNRLNDSDETKRDYAEGKDFMKKGEIYMGMGNKQGQKGWVQNNRFGQRESMDQNKTGGNFIIMCNKCKDTRLLTRKLPHYIICGKNSHITEECAWLKQIKRTPKYRVCCQRTRGVAGAELK